MHHYLATVQYLGTCFAGWQRQAHADTVERHLTHALTQVADEPVTLTCAGRTDAGVHALYQVVSFSISATRKPHQLVRGANSHLPETIRMQSVVALDTPMNARFDAAWREYIYIIDTSQAACAFLSGLVWHLPEPSHERALDTTLMQQAAAHLLGEHDFQAFRAAGCQSHSRMRHVMRVRVWRVGHMVCVQLRANAFLYHMVRNIVGSLVEVGLGKRPSEWTAELLAARDRRQAAPTAPAAGLYLSAVHYPRVPHMPPAPPHFLLGGFV